MFKFQSRVTLSIIAFLSGVALTYRFLAWELLPAPESYDTPLTNTLAIVGILVLLAGWVMIFTRKPKG